MRLNLYWRGRDVIDIEAHVWRKRPSENSEVLVRNTSLDTGFAEDTEPDTYVRGFGFQGSQC